LSLKVTVWPVTKEAPAALTTVPVIVWLARLLVSGAEVIVTVGAALSSVSTTGALLPL
jgi:hypothetical protein